MSGEPLVEVRVPTFRRPAMLQRALRSLTEQTHHNWRAMVLDDSPGHEGAAVVSALNDERLVYRPNERNLGCSANIDQCFQRESFISGSTHAFMLEDDNWVEPEFISSNLSVMQEQEVKLLMRNQWIFWDDGDGVRKTNETCRDGFFAEGKLSRTEIMPHLPFHCGISNGGLMWRHDCVSDLVVGPSVENSSHQEIVRTFQLREPLWYAAQPLAWFRAEAKGWRPGRWHNWTAARATQSMALKALELGPADFWQRAEAIAERHTQMHRGLLDAFAITTGSLGHKFATVTRRQVLLRMVKHKLLRWFVPDPLGAYWKSFRP